MYGWQQRRQTLREILSGSICVQPASVHDPVSTRIAEGLGFEMAMLGGSIVSLSVLGAPDLIVLTLSEFVEQVHRISRASELPLMVDADHGYGNALSVMRTVEELETAGASAIGIEDTRLPVEYGKTGNATLISVEEGVGKMRAALEARQDSNLVIVGRTSAPALTGIEDAIMRAKAYEKAGVDAIFLVGIKTPQELDAVATEITLPLILDGLGPQLHDRDVLAKKGVRVWLRGHQPFAAATQAIYNTLKQLRDGVPPGELTGLASPELMEAVSRNKDYKKIAKKFLG